MGERDGAKGTNVASGDRLEHNFVAVRRGDRLVWHENAVEDNELWTDN